MGDAADDARDREEDAAEMKEAHDMGKCLPYCVFCLFGNQEEVMPKDTFESIGNYPDPDPDNPNPADSHD